MSRTATAIALVIALGAGYAIGLATASASIVPRAPAVQDQAPAAAHDRATVMTPAAGDAGHGAVGADDPTVTDGDHYHVVLENERTRVLAYRDHPGERTHLHRHPDSVLVVLAPFTRRIVFGDGTSRSRTFASGDVVWIPAQTHYGENTGTTDSAAMLIEFKR